MRAPPLTPADAGDERQQQQAGADDEERPLVAAQVVDPAHDDQGGDVGADADQRPRGLQAGEPFGVEAGDHHVAEAVEQRGEREQHAVGAAGEAAGGDVGDDAAARG